MTTILIVLLIVSLALFWRERRIRKYQVNEWSNEYANLWDDYTLVAYTLEELTDIDIRYH